MQLLKCAELKILTIFGRVCRFGGWCDFAWWRSVVTNLMQKVNGFADQENLEGPEGGDDTIL